LLGFISKGIERVRVEVVPGIPDLRYLDLIYPKMPYLDAAKFRSAIPYRMDY
jgi:rare lipoprotein A